MVTMKNKYPFTRIYEIFDHCKALKYTKINLKSEYHQLKIGEEDI